MTAPSERAARASIVMHGASLHQRGYVPGSSGNISLRLTEGFLVTPTNSCLGRLEAEDISMVDFDGKHRGGGAPSKEAFLHLAVYRARPDAGAVVHLHSTYCVALCCRSDLDPDSPIRPLTPYAVMKTGRPGVVPYFPPGDRRLADTIGRIAGEHRAILLSNHGPVVAGRDIDSAVYAIEELEEASKLQLLLEGRPANALSYEQVQQLNSLFPS